MKLVITRQLLVVFALLFSTSATMANESLNINESGVFIHGYDPVSYFDKNPKPGKDTLVTHYQGAKIFFSSTENRDRFNSSPERYMPKYGGFCAFGVRMGQKFDIDPEAYFISENELYLLLDRSTESMWHDDRIHNAGIADRIWDTIADVPAESLSSN